MFAVSGALVAGRKRLDLFGTLAIAFVTALGGGTLRDVLLGATPVFWIREPASVLLAIASGGATFWLMRVVTFPRRVLLILDAMGLGLFSVLGCEKALAMGVTPLCAVLMGMLSGAAGGAIRDVLTAEVPTVLRAEIYATAAAMGAALYALTWYFLAPRDIALCAGAFLTFAVRILALKGHWSMPEARVKEV